MNLNQGKQQTTLGYRFITCPVWYTHDGPQFRDEQQQMIRTTYKGPTNSHGSRIVASADSSWEVGPLSIEYDDALEPEDNHRIAAYKMAKKLGLAVGILVRVHFNGVRYWTYEAWARSTPVVRPGDRQSKEQS